MYKFKYDMFIVNPFVFSQAGGYLVDTYSPVAAYSLRKLSSSATNAIRVRRSSDNAEQDIGFSGDDLDTTSLSSFVGANDGFVVTWYNQGTGGATYDATQSTAANQPQIAASGTIYDGIRNISNDSLLLSTGITTTQLFYNTIVYDRAADNLRVIGLGGTSSQAYPFTHATNDIIQVYMGGALQTVDTQNTSGLNTSTTLRDSSDDIKQWYNGVASTPVNQSGGGTSINTIGRISTSYNGADCELQEIIFHNGDLESSRAAIMSNINSYYSIY